MTSLDPSKRRKRAEPAAQPADELPSGSERQKLEKARARQDALAKRWRASTLRPPD